MKYRYTSALLLMLLWFGPGAQAQQAPAPAAGTARLTGVVLDSVKGAPVPYATVVLLPATPPDKPLTGVAADERGRFVLEKLTPGAYRLQASFVGYGSRTRPVTVAATGTTEAPPLRLPAAGTALGEVLVTASKPVVEVRPDRLVYNADQDITNTGGTAADVLRKAPLLAVDGDGNVKMRGSGNFRVLINNKPSPTLAKNLAEALKSIPAEQIQSVELITTPPAKYDGEGTAGIINIVLKKGSEQKPNGRISASGGNRNSNLNASLNFRTAKVGFTSSLGSGLWYNPGESVRERTNFDGANGDVASLLRQNSDNYNKGGWYYGSVGLDFDPAEHHSFSLAGSLNGWGGRSDQTLVSRTTRPGGTTSTLDDFVRDNRNRFRGTNAELTGTYTRTFVKPGREWSVLAQYASSPSTSGYDFEQYAGQLVPLEPWQASARERSRGRQPGSETTVQTDFVQPLTKKAKLETGLKAIWRGTGSRAYVDILTEGRNPELVRLPERGTDFDYQQNVQAAYMTYSFGLGKKVSASVGGRLERTALSADFRTTGTGFQRSYYSPLPNANAQYTLSEASSLRLAYSRRITRPSIYYLNPFRDTSDPNVVSFGNPTLNAELTNSYELSYNTTIKTASLSVSGSMRRTGNAIEQVSRLIDPKANVTEQTYRNVAANAFYELNVYGSVKPAKDWDLSGGPNVRYITRRSAALGLNRSGFTAGLNLNTSYKLPKEVVLQAFLYGSLRDPQIQGLGSGNLYYSLGAKKSFWDKRADLTLNVANPFTRYWPYRNTLETPFFRETSEYRAFSRSFRLSFGYRFGDAKNGGGRQRKTISNDDVKGGGSQQGGQQ
ncbi:hypothetical protein CDA63_06605 [Hymenobacter amundsenii]|uniref:Uncharacterized protein n=1 Tax=Hymenobacter amundsenii TaxID=2006685 RepID=A0A246FMB3_9BACT|nr:outer membrane beta-barrel family protein [Hymenobacter amundsenii]OWP63878.1 hypothetical protein CDA63_06605 [Hymenobacter amundsenii]